MALKIFCVNGNTRLISESRISIYTKYFTKRGYSVNVPKKHNGI